MRMVLHFEHFMSLLNRVELVLSTVVLHLEQYRLYTLDEPFLGVLLDCDAICTLDISVLVCFEFGVAGCEDDGSISRRTFALNMFGVPSGSLVVSSEKEN